MARILHFSTAGERRRAKRPGSSASLAGVNPHASGLRPAGEVAPTAAEAQRFRLLILPHLDSAYAFARYLTRDAAQAEDIVQDAFLRALRAFPGFRGGDPRAWLFAIVRTTFLSSVRRQPAYPRAELPEDLPADEESAETALVRQGEAAGLRAAIEALPEPFRETLILRELEELSYREIAEVTAVPIGTVMSRLGRARQTLLTLLSDGSPR